MQEDATPVLDKVMALEQVDQDVEFLLELLNDTLDEQEMHVKSLWKAIENNDHTVRRSGFLFKCQEAYPRVCRASEPLGTQSKVVHLTSA